MKTMKTAFDWIRTILVEVPAIVFLGPNKAIEASLQREAEHVRAVAAEYNPSARPIILDDLKTCRTCEQNTLMLVWPHDICVSCWKQLLNLAFDAPVIEQLSLWRDVERLVKTCQDSGGYPWEDPIKIDLAKSSPEDRTKLSKFENPAEVIEQQMCVLIASNNLAGRLEVRRKKNVLYVCAVS